MIDKSDNVSDLSCRICFDLNPPENPDRKIWASELLNSALKGCTGCSVLSTCLSASQHEGEGWWIGADKNDTVKARGFGIELAMFSVPGSRCPYPRLKQTHCSSLKAMSEAVLPTLRKWVQKCDDSHDSCKALMQSSRLPTRIVEILGPGKIRLRETVDEKSPYTCLSYCWGDVSFICTTTASIICHKAEISWDALPKTFKDAIDITSRLGFRYIWIDSLCIVQDDLNDWRREGSKMDQIYSHSSLTIAASKSKNPMEGCYMAYDDGYGKIHWFTGAANEAFAVYARRVVVHNFRLFGSEGAYNGFPLNRRAWAFQERYLSPRVVHFGPQELLWECQVKSSCECDGDNQGLETDWGSQKRQKTSWHLIVQHYSRMALTFDKDVLPALQGIAKSMGHNRTYFAGLWSDSFIEDLIWHCWEGIRPEEWRAPTWSWASVKGEIVFPPPEWDDLESFASVVNTQTVPAGSDPFGQLVSGQLTLKACCLCMQLVCSTGVADDLYLSYKSDPEATPMVISNNHHPANSFITIYGECDMTRFHGETVEVMKIARHPLSMDNPNILYYYMILVRVDNSSDTYERIALLRVDHWVDDEEGFDDFFTRHGREEALTII